MDMSHPVDGVVYPMHDLHGNVVLVRGKEPAFVAATAPASAKNLQSILYSLEGQLRAVFSERDEALERIRVLEMERAERSSRTPYMDKMVSHSEGLQKELMRKELELDVSKKETRLAQLELRCVQKELADALSQIRENVTPQADDTQAQLEAARMEMDDTRSQLEAAQMEMDDTRSQLEVARKQSSDAKAQLEAAQKQASDAKAHLEAARKQANDARVQLEAARKQASDAKAQLETARKQAVRKQADGAQGDVRAQLKAVRKELKQTRAQLAQATDKEWEAVTATQDELERVKRVVSEVESKCRAAVAEKTVLVNQLEAANATTKRLQDDVHKMQRQVRALTKHNTALTQDMVKLKADVADKDAMIESMQLNADEHSKRSAQVGSVAFEAMKKVVGMDKPTTPPAGEDAAAGVGCDTTVLGQDMDAVADLSVDELRASLLTARALLNAKTQLKSNAKKDVVVPTPHAFVADNLVRGASAASAVTLGPRVDAASVLLHHQSQVATELSHSTFVPAVMARLRAQDPVLTTRVLGAIKTTAQLAMVGMMSPTMVTTNNILHATTVFVDEARDSGTPLRNMMDTVALGVVDAFGTAPTYGLAVAVNLVCSGIMTGALASGGIAMADMAVGGTVVRGMAMSMLVDMLAHAAFGSFTKSATKLSVCVSCLVDHYSSASEFTFQSATHFAVCVAVVAFSALPMVVAGGPPLDANLDMLRTATAAMMLVGDVFDMDDVRAACLATMQVIAVAHAVESTFNPAWAPRTDAMDFMTKLMGALADNAATSTTTVAVFKTITEHLVTRCMPETRALDTLDHVRGLQDMLKRMISHELPSAVFSTSVRGAVAMNAYNDLLQMATRPANVSGAMVDAVHAAARELAEVGYQTLPLTRAALGTNLHTLMRSVVRIAMPAAGEVVFGISNDVIQDMMLMLDGFLAAKCPFVEASKREDVLMSMLGNLDMATPAHEVLSDLRAALVLIRAKETQSETDKGADGDADLVPDVPAASPPHTL